MLLGETLAIELKMRREGGTLEKPGGVHLSPLDVAGEVDLVGQLGDVHLEPLLHLVQGLRVRLVTNEGDGQTLGTEPAEEIFEQYYWS